MDVGKRFNSLIKPAADFIAAPESPRRADRRNTERDNLGVLWGLVVRALLELVMKERNRLLASDTRELKDLFILLERVLRHGLKPPPLVSLRSTSEGQLWSLVSSLGPRSSELAESVVCVNGLAGLLSPLSRLRAWLRLGLMQKKLGDYIGIVVEAREMLPEYYESWAFLRSEAAVPFAGSLIGLRVIDCNLYLKEEDLANQSVHVELGHYIRLPSVSADEEAKENEAEELKTILDQKNFLEEHNRQLQANVRNLEQRIETLEKIRGFRPYGEPAREEAVAVAAPVAEATPPPAPEEGEDEDQVGILRRALADKADSLSSLRAQMDDVKRINQDLYTKLRLSEEEAKSGCEEARRWETQLKELESFSNSTTGALSSQLKEATAGKATAVRDRDQIASQLRTAIELREKREAEVAEKEAEVRELTAAGTVHVAQIAEMETELQILRNSEQELVKWRSRAVELEGKVADYERTLEELGLELGGAKTTAEERREGLEALAEAAWERDAAVKECKGCGKEFGVARRRHHCRHCGGIYCGACSQQTMPLPASAKPLRVCDPCYALLLNRFSKPAAN